MQDIPIRQILPVSRLNPYFISDLTRFPRRTRLPANEVDYGCMEEAIPTTKEPFEAEKSPLKEAYTLLHAKSPLELSNLYSAEDQRLMAASAWDYGNPTQLTNRIKIILESVDISSLTEEEKEWRSEILWFWYHHAISCAIWRYKDQRAAQEYSARALEIQPEGHPNQLTRLLYLLVRDKVTEAEAWTADITEEPEKSSAADVIGWYKSGEFYKEHVPK